jgi:starch synthase
MRCGTRRPTRIAAPITAKTLDKRGATSAREKRFGLEPGDGPLFIVVSRLTWQKGMDVCREPRRAGGLRRAAGAARHRRCGDRAGGACAAAARHPGIGVLIGYDEALSHLMQAVATPSSCRRASSRAG